MNNKLKNCDYLVVGSGASGAVVAARLSEVSENRVVVLEAGGKDTSLLLRLPGLGFAVANHPKFNWGFLTEPIPAMKNRELTWLQGKVLGGSSSINGMIYTRGHSREYDLWRQMGCEGWASNDVLPFFKKAESNERGAGPWHGASGPIKVRRSQPKLTICDAFLNAARAEGFPVLDDMNQDPEEGFGFYDINAGHGRRMSTATAYLRPARKRKNLRILANAEVSKVCIENGRATGAQFVVNGVKRSIYADKEVILCAGAIKTPQILLLSGIGPADDLKNWGIKVIVDSQNVGKGLQNHVCYRIQYLCSEPVSASRNLHPWNMVKAGLEYAVRRTGPLAESYAVAGGFFRSDPSLEMADAQVVLLSALGPTRAGGAKFRIRDLLPKEHGFGLTVYQGSPLSRGSVSLRSNNPLEQPRIHAGYFSELGDIHILKKAVNRMRMMMKQPAISQYITSELAPGEKVFDDESLEAEIRQNAATAYHQSGSCAMGGGQNSVLDSQLRVRGIDNLRVADASIMPRIPNAALHAPTIMIGEKAAAMLRSKYES